LYGLSYDEPKQPEEESGLIGRLFAFVKLRTGVLGEVFSPLRHGGHGESKRKNQAKMEGGFWEGGKHCWQAIRGTRRTSCYAPRRAMDIEFGDKAEWPFVSFKRLNSSDPFFYSFFI
jgi:hypothetical protein